MTDLPARSTVTLSADAAIAAGQIGFASPDTQDLEVGISVLRSDAAADATLTARTITLSPAHTLSVSFQDWDGNPRAALTATLTGPGSNTTNATVQGR